MTEFAMYRRYAVFRIREEHQSLLKDRLSWKPVVRNVKYSLHPKKEYVLLVLTEDVPEAQRGRYSNIRTFLKYLGSRIPAEVRPLRGRSNVLNAKDLEYICSS
ncbi:MAG: hypothetical protein AABX86_01875 [Nanoarchaeota archaeon]